MKQVGALFNSAPSKVHNATPLTALVSPSDSASLSDSKSALKRSARVEPAGSLRELRLAPSSSAIDEARTNSLKTTLQSNATALFHRLPTIRKLVGGSTGDIFSKTGSGRTVRSSSNRRIRRREFHFVPPAPNPEKLKKMRWVVMPRSTWKVRWDLWIGAIILYSVVLIPYRIGFAVDLSDWEEMLNYLFDASFAIDVLLNFFTGFFDDDAFVYDLPKIRARYLKSWFLFDVLSTLPMDQFFKAITTTPGDPSLLSFKLLRTIRLFRLLKLMRLLRLKRAVDAIQLDALNAHVLQTFRGLLMIIFLIHVISCAWYMFYTWDPNGINWVTNIDLNGVPNPYLVSFYWVANTMMSVGYGDIYGVTDGERLFSIFVECVGSICVGLIIANIQMLTENYNPRGVKMSQKLQETKEFLLKRSIPRRLRQRVISQFEYHWSRRTVFDEDKLLHQFPKSLQYEILASSMESFVKKFPFFGMTSVDFFVFTIPRLRPIVVGIGQTLVEAESVWEELYFVVSGSMEATRGNTVASTLTGGDICGIEYLVGDRRRYVHTYRSTMKTEVYAIYTADLIEGMESCAIATKYLRDLAHIITERYADAARRGRKMLQKQEGSQRRASLELFLQYRHRKSTSYNNLLKDQTDQGKRFNLSIADDIQLHWTIIRHYSRQRILWDTVMGVVVAWTTMSVPFRISFDIRDTYFLSLTDRLSDILFCLDVAANFFTTYVDETGVEIIDRHEIRRHYLKTSFFVDVVSTIPFDFVVEVVTASEDFRSLKLIRTVKLVKLLRLVRIAKIFKMNSQWISELDISMDTVRLLKLLAPVLTIAHYVGCFWYYMSADQKASEAWWGRIHLDYPDSNISKYIASVYWATTTMATVGFGDIYAVNSYEQMYSIIVMIGGTTLFAYVVGTVIEVVSNSKSLLNREHEMGQRINAYVKERGVSSDFVLACQEHLRYLNNERTLFYEQGLFDALSHSLRSELILYLNGNVLNQIRFFDKKPKWFLTLLLPRLVPQYFLQGDLLIYHGNLASGIFFLMSGAVIARVPQHSQNEHEDGSGAEKKKHPMVVSVSTNGRTTDAVPDPDGTIATIYEGEFFGYKEVLTRTPAQYNVFACQPTGTYILPREYLDFIRELYPDVLEEMRRLFLHSINKQQTILHHWHNNDIMGISGVERDQILRATVTEDFSRRVAGSFIRSHHLAEVEESLDQDEDTTPRLPSDSELHQHPLTVAEPAPEENGDRSSTTCELVSNEPAFAPVRRMSFFKNPVEANRDQRDAEAQILSHDTASTTANASKILTGAVFEHGESRESTPTNEQDSTTPYRLRPQRPSEGDTTPVRANSAVMIHEISRPPQRLSSRRSSFVAPRRAPPPLLRYPSMPDEITAMVNRLLEVEGYVSPNKENGETEEPAS